MAIWKREQNLKAGDLVHHILYGKEWLAVILSTTPYSGSAQTRTNKILVRMIPGTDFDDFFDKRPVVFRERFGTGWVSDQWLVKVGSQNVIEE